MLNTEYDYNPTTSQYATNPTAPIKLPTKRQLSETRNDAEGRYRLNQSNSTIEQ